MSEWRDGLYWLAEILNTLTVVWCLAILWGMVGSFLAGRRK